MTTPYERLKALQMARDVMSAIRDDRQFSPLIREQAGDVLSSYPENDYLAQLVAKNELGLPHKIAAALSRCSSFLHAVAHRLQSQERPEALSDLVRVLRHLPDTGELEHLQALHSQRYLIAHYAEGISAWITTEEPMPSSPRVVAPKISRATALSGIHVSPENGKNQA